MRGPGKMNETLYETLKKRIEKLERDMAVLKSERKAIGEKNSADDEWYIRTWDHKVR